jgi:hypothetical protein
VLACAISAISIQPMSRLTKALNTATPQHRKEPNPAACKGCDSGLFCAPGEGRRAAKRM